MRCTVTDQGPHAGPVRRFPTAGARCHAHRPEFDAPVEPVAAPKMDAPTEARDQPNPVGAESKPSVRPACFICGSALERLGGPHVGGDYECADPIIVSATPKPTRSRVAERRNVMRKVRRAHDLVNGGAMERYAEALLEARDFGVTDRELADALGVTTQAIHYARSRRPEGA